MCPPGFQLILCFFLKKMIGSPGAMLEQGPFGRVPDNAHDDMAASVLVLLPGEDSMRRR